MGRGCRALLRCALGGECCQPDQMFALACHSAASQPAEPAIAPGWLPLVCRANFHFSDFVLNWVHHMGVRRAAFWCCDRGCPLEARATNVSVAMRCS